MLAPMATTPSAIDGDGLSVKLMPNEITEDDFEELLATDRMFRDCFNEYLAQPIFTEKLRFNPVTFAFELKSEERDQVVSMIREAVFYARQKPQSQKLSNLHAYRPISLLPMEFDVKEPPNIKSEFSVELLESEGANEWIKRHRLPMFLNSDLYHFYRMGRLLNQSASIYRSSGRTSVIFDNSPQAKRIRTPKSATSVAKLDREETYVSFGASLTTDSGQRYTQSAMGTGTTMATSMTTTMSTFSSDFNAPRLSEILSRPKSARPSRTSAFPSRPDSVVPSVTPLSETANDSGRDSSGDELTSVPPVDTASVVSRDIGSALSIIPLPSELICVAEQAPLGPLEIRSQDTQRASPSEDTSGRGTAKDTYAESFATTEDPNEGLHGLEKCRDPGVAQALITSIRKAFPSRKVPPESMLSRLMLNPHFERIVNNLANVEQAQTADIHSLIERAEMLEQEDGEVESISGEVFGDDAEENEVNVDDKDVSAISNLEMFKAFEQFIKKSSGWPVFSLWLDIDRLKRKYDTEALKLTPPVRQFLSSMRQRYLKPGGEFCLSSAIQEQLKLSDPDEWTIPNLLSIQPQLMQTLLSYWVIRFFVQENTKSHEFLKNNAKYQMFKNELVGYDRPVHPVPKTPSALPIRPKTCLPRTKPLDDPPKPNRFNSSLTQVKLSPRDPEMPFRRSYLISLEQETPEPPPEPVAKVPVRAKTAPPTRTKTSANEEVKPVTPPAVNNSTLFGTERMEKLFKVLKMESFTGQFLEQFIRQTNNKSWLNALLFWLELQKYHLLFTDEFPPDSEAMASCAKHLYSTYIMEGAADCIGVSKAIGGRILKQLDPPYEELFDEAEERVILTLYEALEAVEKESAAMISSIGKQTLSRKVETTNAEILQLNALGMFRNSAALPRDFDEYSEGSSQLPAGDKTLWQLVPEAFRDWTLERIVFNRVELEAFRLFLEQNKASFDLSCWMDVEGYRRLPPGSDQIMHAKATDIKEKYLNRKYFFGATSPAMKKEQTEMLERNGGWAKLMAVVPPPSLLTEVQSYARRRLDNKWIPLFLATVEFAERQKPLKDDSIEDEATALKRRRAQQIAKMLEGHWSTTAQEALIFRNALSSVQIKKLFYRFLKLRNAPGEYLPNDLQFYDEVQKYKQLYHTHAEDALINTKVSQIITCFLDDTHRHPSLQIDIPQEMAEKIVWHKKELGAYLFRDAQLTVFRILMTHWPDFCKFRETVPDVPETVRTKSSRKPLYPSKAPVKTGFDPKHFMDALERRKIVLDRKRLLKEKEAYKAQEEAEAQAKEVTPETAPAGSVAAGDVDEDYNPFGSQASQTVRNRVWRYSEYQYRLERELLLNNTDRSTFMLDEQEYDKAVQFFPNLFDSNST